MDEESLDSIWALWDSLEDGVLGVQSDRRLLAKMRDAAETLAGAFMADKTVLLCSGLGMDLWPFQMRAFQLGIPQSRCQPDNPALGNMLGMGVRSKPPNVSLGDYWLRYAHEGDVAFSALPIAAYSEQDAVVAIREGGHEAVALTDYPWPKGEDAGVNVIRFPDPWGKVLVHAALEMLAEEVAAIMDGAGCACVPIGGRERQVQTTVSVTGPGNPG